jgi:acetyl-CoA synthetase
VTFVTPWFRRWDRVFEWNFPTFRWFIGAETNLACNAVDRHVEAGRGGHAALIYSSREAVTLDREPGDITTIEDEGSVEEARQAWRQMKGIDNT